MSNNYFAIERGNQCWDHVILADSHGNPAFEDFLNMSYDEMKSREDLSNFVVAAMNAANRKTNHKDDQTIVTLIGDDDVFIWGILMGPHDNDGYVSYCLIDWQKDGKKYRYQVENNT